MAATRDALLGPPHTYYCSAATSWDQPCFATREDRMDLLELLELLRQAFDLRLFAYAIADDRYHLVLRHRDSFSQDDGHLVKRWLDGGGGPVPAKRLRARLTSLSGLMQTFAQRSSRRWHRRNGGRGPLWAARYRSCLLADDTALLAAVTWVETVAGSGLAPAATSCGRERTTRGTPQLAPLPLRATPDGTVYPADETPLDLPPPTPPEADHLYRRFAAELAPHDLASYGEALARAWSLGRPESLTESLARLGRDRGRGRSRRMRELEDDYGLCGVWG